MSSVAFDYYYPPIRRVVPETPDSNSKLDKDRGNEEVRSEAEWDEPDPLSGRHEFVDSTSCARLR